MVVGIVNPMDHNEAFCVPCAQAEGHWGQYMADQKSGAGLDGWVGISDSDPDASTIECLSCDHPLTSEERGPG